MKDKRPIRAIRLRELSALHPYTKADHEAFMAIKPGEPVEITIKQRRSLPQLQAYWAMLDKVVKATEAYPSAEHLHEALKMELGYVTPVVVLSTADWGAPEIVRIPDSVAFSKMRAPEFREYFARCEKLIAEQFGIDVETLRKEAA